MGEASPFDLLLITIALTAMYAAMAWRFVLVPVQRRRDSLQRHPVMIRVQSPAVRRVQTASHLRLVVENSAQR